MCFSATASITAGVVIGATGIISFTRSRTPSQQLFSLIPILFSIQQFTEGFVWLSFTKLAIAHFRHDLTLFFLIFAWVIWPIFIPLVIARLEPIPSRKKILYGIIGLGICVTGIYLMFLCYGNPEPRIDSFHIDYYLTENPDFFPKFDFTLFYILATVTPFFISSIPRMRILGIVDLIGLLISIVFYRHALPSTWCFFASIFSIIIIYVIDGMNKKTNTILVK